MIICTYLFIAHIYGTVKLGIKFLFIQLFSFKKSDSNGLGIMFISGYNSLVSLGVITFLNELAGEYFSVSTGFIKNELFKNYVPYYDFISTFFIFQFLIIFVYSMSTSYSTAGQKEYVDYEVNDESLDEERALLNII